MFCDAPLFCFTPLQLAPEKAQAVAVPQAPEVPSEKENPVARNAHYSTSPKQGNLGLPEVADVQPPLVLRKTPRNPLVLPSVSSVPGPGVLVSGGGARRVRGGKSSYVKTLEPAEAGKKFVRLEGQARLDAAVPCLERALELVQRPDGWCKGATHDEAGRVSLNGALQVGSKDALEAFFAREVIRRVIFDHDFTAWNDHPFRVRADVVRALKAALKVCGAHSRRGGWQVSR